MSHNFPCSLQRGNISQFINLTCCTKIYYCRLDIMVVSIFPMIPNLFTHLTHTGAHVQAEEKAGTQRVSSDKMGVAKCGGAGHQFWRG